MVSDALCSHYTRRPTGAGLFSEFRCCSFTSMRMSERGVTLVLVGRHNTANALSAHRGGHLPFPRRVVRDKQPGRRGGASAEPSSWPLGTSPRRQAARRWPPVNGFRCRRRPRALVHCRYRPSAAARPGGYWPASGASRAQGRAGPSVRVGPRRAGAPAGRPPYERPPSALMTAKAHPRAGHVRPGAGVPRSRVPPPQRLARNRQPPAEDVPRHAALTTEPHGPFL
jgi:hypothetical protein